MKRLIYLFTLTLFVVSCNSESDKASTPVADSVNTAPVNDMMSNPNHTPGSNTPGEAMGNGDTSSYERMSQKVDSGR
ncbi:MAG: hypothetical protein ABWZ25_19675 [Chitinophagaceae bacterium]